jgi:hypothetical protein
MPHSEDAQESAKTFLASIMLDLFDAGMLIAEYMELGLDAEGDVEEQAVRDLRDKYGAPDGALSIAGTTFIAMGDLCRRAAGDED